MHPGAPAGEWRCGAQAVVSSAPHAFSNSHSHKRVRTRTDMPWHEGWTGDETTLTSILHPGPASKQGLGHKPWTPALLDAPAKPAGLARPAPPRMQAQLAQHSCCDASRKCFSTMHPTRPAHAHPEDPTLHTPAPVATTVRLPPPCAPGVAKQQQGVGGKPLSPGSHSQPAAPCRPLARGSPAVHVGVALL